MEIGLGRVLELLEERFGRRAITALLFLLYLGIAAICINALWSMIVKPIYEAVSAYIPSGRPEITVVTVFYVTAFIAAAIISFPLLYVFLSKRKVSQEALDKLAELREEGINTVYAAPVKSESEFVAWKVKKADWERKLREYLKNHFPKSDYSFASNLGVVPLQNNLTALNTEHVWELSYVVRQLDLVEQILNSYRR